MADTIQIRKDTLWKASTVILAIAVAWLLFFSPSSGNSGSGKVALPDSPGKTTGAAVNVADMEKLSDDDAFKGDKNAPVTIVEWSDFECPFCGRFYSQTLGQIEKDYIDTGKVKLVYRDFPLRSIHPNAQKAAEAAECAGEQGKFFEMHDLLFERGVSRGPAAFKEYAKEIGLDEDKFNECLDTGAMAGEVEKDLQDGTSVGIRGTPGFIINGKLVSGAQPYSVFKAEIESALRNS